MQNVRLHHDEHVSNFFSYLKYWRSCGSKKNLPAPAPNDQTWHIPSVLDLRKLYVQSNCPPFWVWALRRAWYIFYIELKRRGILQYIFLLQIWIDQNHLFQVTIFSSMSIEGVKNCQKSHHFVLTVSRSNLTVWAEHPLINSYTALFLSNCLFHCSFG